MYKFTIPACKILTIFHRKCHDHITDRGLWMMCWFRVTDWGLVFVLCTVPCNIIYIDHPRCKRQNYYHYITLLCNLLTNNYIIMKKNKLFTFWTGGTSKVKILSDTLKECWLGPLFSHRKWFSISWEHNVNVFPKYLKVFF